MDMGQFPPGHTPFPDDYPGAPSPHNFDEGRRSPFEHYDDTRPKGNKKKDQKGNVDKSPLVETELVGYSFYKEEPLPGQKRSWARVGRRSMPFDSKRLLALVKEHRKQTRSGPAKDWADLGNKQQGIINRVLEEHKTNEKNVNADWVMVAVMRTVDRHLTKASETVRMQVILKRFDKREGKIGGGSGVKATGANDHNIIDLADPLPTKKADKGNKKNKKNQVDEPFNIGDETPGFGALPYDQYQPQGAQQQNPNPMFDQPHRDLPMNDLPPGSIPINPQYDNLPPPQTQHPQIPYQGHPFQPNAEFANPDQHLPVLDNGHEMPRARVQTRPSTPHHRRSSSAQRVRRLEDELEDLRKDNNNLHDDLESVRNKVENWNFSNDGSQYEDDVFSQPCSGGYSTPPSEFSFDNGPRGSLHRRKSFARQFDQLESPSRSREHRYRAEREQSYRSQRYRDGRVNIQPAYTHYHREIRYSPERERPRYSKLPRLVRSSTVDDYPQGRFAEPAIMPPRIQPRLAELADFNDQSRPRKSRRHFDFDYQESPYENWPREGVPIGSPRRQRRKTNYHA